jgi:LPXTG-site transpeptidase (sortase) family protein
MARTVEGMASAVDDNRPLPPVITGAAGLEVRRTDDVALVGASPPAAPAGPGRPAASAQDRPLYVVSSVLTIVSIMALTFMATISVVGGVRHARDQQTAFALLRGQLATGTAPVTQTDAKGRLRPLGTPVAVLDIPQIGLREVVLEGTTSGVLRSGPGHRRDSALPGQEGVSVLMGRQAAFGGPFHDIKRLRKGQVFTVTTGQGTATYRVIGVRRAGDPAPPLVQAGKGRMILMTAAGGDWVPQGTLRVDADLVSTQKPGERPAPAVHDSGPRPLMAASLPLPERPLQGEPGVWVWVLLLTQLLFAASVAVTWARFRWGAWQAWTAGGPLLLAIGVALSAQVARLLPNLM